MATNRGDPPQHTTQQLVRYVAGSVLASLVVALTVFYVGFGQNAVTKDQLQNAINTYSPYARDRQLILTDLGRLNHDVLALQANEHNTLKDEGSETARLDKLERDVARLLGLHTKP